MVKIAIIGAGINGLGTAVKIKETYKDTEVVLISNEFSPNTTGDGSGGLWYPYLCGTTPEQSILKWGMETYKLYHKMWLKGGFDVCLIPVCYLNKESTVEQRPKWASDVFGYQIFNQEQIKYFRNHFNTEFGSGATFSSFIVKPGTILKYLMDKFIRANGKVLRAEVASLSDPLLDGFDVVVICSGLGSRKIVPDDTVFAIRGQISKVLAPWVSTVVIDESKENYIIPNVETCVLGGTHQEHNYNTQIDNADAEFIRNGCLNMMPGLKNAKLVNEWTGLRPARHEVRLEAEKRDGKLFINNYGHGGSGLTLFWGCAGEVLELLKEKLDVNVKSKL